MRSWFSSHWVAVNVKCFYRLLLSQLLSCLKCYLTHTHSHTHPQTHTLASPAVKTLCTFLWSFSSFFYLLNLFILYSQKQVQNCLGIIQFLFLLYFLKRQIKIPSPLLCFPESRGSRYNESKMNAVSSSQTLDATKALLLRCAQWKHCSCGISIGNTVLVVFFQWKNYYCGIMECCRKCWPESCNGQPRGREVLNWRVTLR